MNERISGSEWLLRAAERVGQSSKENFEWLVDFVQDRALGALSASDGLKPSDAVPLDIWNEVRLFAHGWRSPINSQATVSLSISDAREAQLAALQGLQDLAANKATEFLVPGHMHIIGEVSDSYNAAVKDMFLIKCDRLMSEFRS